MALAACLVSALLLAAVVRLPRPVPPADLTGQIAFLLGDNCPQGRCPQQIGVVHGEGYRTVPLPAEPLAFAWSPDGSRLAVVGRADAESPSRLYVADADGTNAEPITALNFMDGLSWSPDGRWLTFSYNHMGDSGIYRIGFDGSAQTRLTNGIVGMSPQWSPSGAWILFQARAFQGLQIFLVHPETSGIRNLTGDNAYDYSPQWSPDGSRILFLSRERARIFSSNGVPLTQAFITDERGRNTRQISSLYGNVFGARWSPNGDMLAFYVAEAHTELPFWGNLYLMDIAHGVTVQLTQSSITNNIGDFEWSPDGTRLAYIASPLEYSRVCVLEIGGDDVCVAGDRIRKSDVRWLNAPVVATAPSSR